MRVILLYMGPCEGHEFFYIKSLKQYLVQGKSLVHIGYYYYYYKPILEDNVSEKYEPWIYSRGTEP